MSDRALIEIRDITKTYRMGGDIEVHALRGVSLELDEGELLSIMGPSGSGKSTLMNVLGCLDQPTSGEYYLDGVDIKKLNDHLDRLARQRAAPSYEKWIAEARAGRATPRTQAASSSTWTTPTSWATAWWWATRR